MESYWFLIPIRSCWGGGGGYDRNQSGPNVSFLKFKLYKSFHHFTYIKIFTNCPSFLLLLPKSLTISVKQTVSKYHGDQAGEKQNFSVFTKHYDSIWHMYTTKKKPGWFQCTECKLIKSQPSELFKVTP